MKTKIILISALFIISIMINNKVDAQIVYTDINPDTVLDGGNTPPIFTAYYYLNLDNDTAKDFKMGHCEVGFPTDANIRPLSTGEILYDNSITTRNYALALNYGATIDNNTPTWTNSISYLGYHHSLQGVNMEGNWIGVSDKYLGLRINLNGQWHYGWAKCDVAALIDTYTIKEYAYNTTPNQGITAGDKGPVNIKENFFDNISIYSHDKTLFIDFKDTEINNGKIKLFNLMGQEVKTIPISNSNIELDLNNIDAGIYIVNIYNKTTSVNYKINLE